MELLEFVAMCYWKTAGDNESQIPAKIILYISEKDFELPDLLQVLSDNH